MSEVESPERPIGRLAAGLEVNGQSNLFLIALKEGGKIHCFRPALPLLLLKLREDLVPGEWMVPAVVDSFQMSSRSDLLARMPMVDRSCHMHMHTCTLGHRNTPSYPLHLISDGLRQHPFLAPLLDKEIECVPPPHLIHLDS